MYADDYNDMIVKEFNGYSKGYYVLNSKVYNIVFIQEQSGNNGGNGELPVADDWKHAVINNWRITAHDGSIVRIGNLVYNENIRYCKMDSKIMNNFSQFMTRSHPVVQNMWKRNDQLFPYTINDTSSKNKNKYLVLCMDEYGKNVNCPLSEVEYILDLPPVN